MKVVKIVRVAKGQEIEGEQQLADFYNKMEKNARTSRAIITSVGDDIVYTVFADVYEDKSEGDDSVNPDDPDGLDDEDGGNDDGDDEDFLS